MTGRLSESRATRHLAEPVSPVRNGRGDNVVVSVGIKALNEEKHIAAALESAVAAVDRVGGEVILADSGSTDRTVEIAQGYPVRIVQLANPAERCCGAGAQLAYQAARGDYFYILDGDMVLDPGFLPAGIAYLEANPDVAAVGGIVTERNVEGEEFQIRSRATQLGASWRPGLVDRLDCGGLFRTSALQEVGYFADRNLHAFEEFEVAARLSSLGWKLARIDAPAVDHFGHTTGGYRLLWRRIRSGYSGAAGEVLRGAIGRRHLPIVLSRLGHVRNGLVVMLWWVAMLLSMVALGSLSIPLLMIVIPAGFLSFRRRSVGLGLYSFVAWNVGALGLLTGFVRKRVPPQHPLASIDLTPSHCQTAALD